MSFIKKNTPGSAAGITWESGEVKEVDAFLADELEKLAPEDFEIVKVDSPATVSSEGDQQALADAQAQLEEDTETLSEAAEKVAEDGAPKPKASTKKATKTPESPSAE